MNDLPVIHRPLARTRRKKSGPSTVCAQHTASLSAADSYDSELVVLLPGVAFDAHANTSHACRHGSATP